VVCRVVNPSNEKLLLDYTNSQSSFTLRFRDCFISVATASAIETMPRHAVAAEMYDGSYLPLRYGSELDPPRGGGGSD